MSTESKHDLKDQIRDTAHKVSSEVEGHAKDIKERASDALDRATGLARDARDKGHEIYDQARERGHELYNQARDKSCDLVGQAKETIRRNPIPVVVGVATLGVAIGWMLCHRRKSYLDGDDIASMFKPLRKRIRSHYEDLKDRGEDLFDTVQDNIPSHPLDKLACSARSFGKNLKFW